MTIMFQELWLGDLQLVSQSALDLVTVETPAESANQPGLVSMTVGVSASTARIFCWQSDPPYRTDHQWNLSEITKNVLATDCQPWHVDRDTAASHHRVFNFHLLVDLISHLDSQPHNRLNSAGLHVLLTVIACDEPSSRLISSQGLESMNTSAVSPETMREHRKGSDQEARW